MKSKNPSIETTTEKGASKSNTSAAVAISAPNKGTSVKFKDTTDSYQLSDGDNASGACSSLKHQKIYAESTRRRQNGDLKGVLKKNKKEYDTGVPALPKSPPAATNSAKGTTRTAPPRTGASSSYKRIASGFKSDSRSQTQVVPPTHRNATQALSGDVARSPLMSRQNSRKRPADRTTHPAARKLKQPRLSLADRSVIPDSQEHHTCA